MSIKAVIDKDGQKGDEVMMKELSQLHDRKAMLPKRKDELPREDRQRAFRYLMFIEEKRDGTVKARGCADGRPQKEYTEKEESSSPTMSFEAMMMLCAIDATEESIL